VFHPLLRFSCQSRAFYIILPCADLMSIEDKLYFPQKENERDCICVGVCMLGVCEKAASDHVQS
jgi:hypothetical protein